MNPLPASIITLFLPSLYLFTLCFLLSPLPPPLPSLHSPLLPAPAANPAAAVACPVASGSRPEGAAAAAAPAWGPPAVPAETGNGAAGTAGGARAR
jgi:hypothetical protein